MDADQQMTIDSLVNEVEALQTRIELLESQIGQLKCINNNQQSTGSSRPAYVKPDRLPTDAPAPKPVKRPAISENFIGGKLLNRIGVLIVIFAMAYFLKWSFDNHLIGELGRCVLGLLTGVGLMVAGQIFLKRNFTVFAQGLMGAGIAIIYLSSYAAVNYYHLISPYMAFALMFLTALGSGVLAAVGNMPGTAVIATLGGFLVPFLMGSHSGQIVPLLSYIAILNLGILFLAYYRRWVFLNLIALAGTAAICGVAFDMNWTIWIGQVYLTGFLLLFLAVAALETNMIRFSQRFLLIASSLFFICASFANLSDKLSNWLGLISLAFALVYLAYYCLLNIKSKPTPIFFKTILVIAMTLALLTAPLQLEGVYAQLAWLAAAAVLLYSGQLIHPRVPFAIALLITTAVFISAFEMYTQSYPTPVFNKATLILTLCTVVWSWAMLLNQRYYQRRFINSSLALFIIGTIFYLLAFNINNAIYYYQANQSFTFLIPVSWALVSSLVLWLGVHRENMSIRMFSLVLFGLVILRTLFYDLRQLDTAFKIMVLLAIGIISLAISFFYQKRMKGEFQE